jgi:hypothetical protein
MARGIGILAPDAETARERFLAEAPDRKVIAVTSLDISDIPLRVPFDEPYWAVAFEDPDPDKFLQDADPIAKATRDVREGLQTMVADPEALTTGMVEGNVVCPGCGETVHLELPPEDLVRRPDFGPFLYTRCPECRADLVGPKGPGRIDWRVRPAPAQISHVDAPAALGRGRGERRACVFCGAEDRKISKEHLWSKWMATYVDPSGGTANRKSRILSTKTGQVKGSKSWPEAAFGQEVSGPCKLCNEGWMEQVEDEARPFLIPMLEDRKTELRPEGQRAVVRWATLKLLAAHLGHPAEKQSIPAARFSTVLHRPVAAPGRTGVDRAVRRHRDLADPLPLSRVVCLRERRDRARHLQRLSRRLLRRSPRLLLLGTRVTPGAPARCEQGGGISGPGLARHGDGSVAAGAVARRRRDAVRDGALSCRPMDARNWPARLPDEGGQRYVAAFRSSMIGARSTSRPPSGR